MRYLLLLLLFSCAKQKQEPKGCDFGLSPEEIKINLKKPPKGHGNPHVPPPTYTGQAVILLDFDGHYVSSSSWGNIECNPSGLDSVSALEVFNKVSSLYFPWQVIVTVDTNIYNLANPSRRVRCILTTSYEWFGQSGGVAFVNSFTFGEPCFVFTSCLGFNIKYIKEAACHEIGHTIGLYHQSLWSEGVKLSEYDFGCCGSAPVMGCAYYQDSSKFVTGLDSWGRVQNDTLKISSVIRRR
jgi:hypothetical protein